SVIATRVGLEIVAGKQRRLVPWQRVWNIRELPWTRCNPAWYPKIWQLDLAGGESFGFVGVRRSREIVRAFWMARREAAETDSKKR
ncbi:MAG: hypothetical protein ABW061_19775, partial [Polyangiaceae bacterium]